MHQQCEIRRNNGPTFEPITLDPLTGHYEGDPRRDEKRPQKGQNEGGSILLLCRRFRHTDGTKRDRSGVNNRDPDGTSCELGDAKLLLYFLKGTTGMFELNEGAF